MDAEAAEGRVALRGNFFATALIAVGILVTVFLLITGFGLLGLITSVALIAVAAFVIFQHDSERELRALQRSIGHSASDISRVLQQWDQFHYSGAPEHVRDRLSHRPCLLNPNCGVDSVRRFHEEADAAEGFLRSLPRNIQASTSVSSLTVLLHDTDHHAARLSTLWNRARRDAGTIETPAEAGSDVATDAATDGRGDKR